MFSPGICAGALLLCLSVSPLSAQDREAEPQEEQKPSQQLRLAGSWSGGYDGNILAQTTGVVDPRFQRGGVHTGGGAGLLYSRRRDRLEFGGEANTSAGLYRTPDVSVSRSYDASANFAVQLTRRTRFRASGGGSYWPFYQLDELPMLMGPGHIRIYYIRSPEQVLNTNATGTLTYRLGKTSSMEIEFAKGRTQFLTGELNLSSTTQTLRYSRGVTKHGSFRLEYLHQQGQYVLNQARAHTVQAAFDISGGDTAGRRTVVGFAFGSSAVENGNRVQHQPTGALSLSHLFSRTWIGKAEYKRYVSFVGGFQQPILSDDLTLSLLDRLTRNGSIQWQAGYSHGSGAISAGATGVQAYYGGGRFQYRLGSRVTAFVESFHYNYRFHGDALVQDVPFRLNRTVATIGMQLSMPLLAEREFRATR